MPSLIDIRRRIRSVRSTQQITRAMKLVSAAKLRGAQDRVIAARPYAALLRRVLSGVAARTPREERRIALIFVTSDKGLAGAFNTNLIKGSQQFVEEHRTEVEFVLIGRKGRDFWRKRGATVAAEHVQLKRPEYALAAEIAGSLMERFRAAEIDAVYLLYNEFKSALSQKLTLKRVLPVTVPERTGGIEYIFEQPPAEMLGWLLPRYVETEIYGAMLETAAAEHAARMTAMDAATTNAAEMIDRLTLYMNRVRQASITKEIIEVVSGAAGVE